MRYPSNSHLLSSNTTCPHNPSVPPRTLGFRRSASVGCPSWPTSPTMPVTLSSKRQAHTTAGNIPTNFCLKKRTLAPKRSNSLREDFTYLNFGAEDQHKFPHLLLPTLATSPNQPQDSIRLEFRPSRPVSPVEVEVSEDKDMMPSLPLIPTLEDAMEYDQEELPIRLTPRPTFKAPMLEPPAPPCGKRCRLISFDSNELSEDLFFPLDGW